MVSVRRSLAWMILSQGGFFVIQFGGSITIARLLSPYEMGISAVAYAIIGILNVIRTLGLVTFLVREPVLTHETVVTSFTINTILATLTGAVIAALSSLGGALLGEVGVQRVLLLLSVTPVLNIFELIPMSQLERHGDFRSIAAINLIRISSLTGVSLVMAWLGFSYMSIAWGTLSSAILCVVCANLIGWRFVSLRIGLRDWRRVGAFGVRILLIGVMGTIAGRVSEVMLGRLVGLSALGLYSRASGLSGLLNDNIHAVIARIVFVDFAERKRRSLPLHESYLRIVALITALLWPAFAGLAILAGPVVLTFYGSQWLAAAPPLSCLALAGLIGTSITMTNEIFVVAGETDRLLRLEAGRNAISLVMFTLGCLAGLVWAAVARIGDSLVAVLIYRREIRGMTRTCSSDYFGIYRQSAMLTFAACSPSALLMAVNHWSEYTPLPAVIAAILIGITTWACGLWLLRHPLFIECEAVARRIMGRYRRA
jgi:O-antigen/teichoic acid export membrane protein